MNRLFLVIPCMFLFASSAIWAQAHRHHHDHPDDAVPQAQVANNMDAAVCTELITVKVHGLVCDFCARALEKVFSRREDVLGLSVDLDKGNVEIAMKPGRQIDEATLSGLINDSGYSVVNIDKGC